MDRVLALLHWVLAICSLTLVSTYGFIYVAGHEHAHNEPVSCEAPVRQDHSLLCFNLVFVCLDDGIEFDSCIKVGKKCKKMLYGTSH